MPAAVPEIPLGPTDERVPRLGQGTWQMERDDRGACIRALRRGIELGARLVDTAEMYGSGRVESLVGEALDGLREEVFLVTKVLPSNATRQGTRRALEASLDRLGTDHVDLYLLHWPSRHPIEDTMAAFREIVEEGLARHVGVSNVDLDGFQQAQAALGGDQALVADQVLYWLGARNIENELLPGLAQRRVTVMAYSPFGSGRLPGPGSAKGQALAKVAQALDATAHQVALAWTMRHEHVLPIPKASQVAHVEENVAALQLELEEEHLSVLDEAFEPSKSTRLETL